MSCSSAISRGKLNGAMIVTGPYGKRWPETIAAHACQTMQSKSSTIVKHHIYVCCCPSTHTHAQTNRHIHACIHTHSQTQKLMHEVPVDICPMWSPGTEKERARNRTWTRRCEKISARAWPSLLDPDNRIAITCRSPQNHNTLT